MIHGEIDRVVGVENVEIGLETGDRIIFKKIIGEEIMMIKETQVV